jgi:ParB family chromosome partitioning protein
MPPEKYVELRENLRHNRLITPISVQIGADGEFILVSGHHRSDAFRELGRPTIRGVIEEGTTDEAEDGAFFANLMQSDLTDYEKYVGLKRIQGKHEGLSQAGLAERVGISASGVNALLAFDRLPAEARAMLESHKSAIGASAAAELAALTEAGKGAGVIEAIKRLTTQQVDQKQAVRFAKEGEKPKATPPAAATFKVKSGRTTWCDVRLAKNVMRLEFQSEEVAKAVQDSLRATLENLATQTDANTK